MTVECVDGRSGRPHIDGADKGRLHAGVVGAGSVVLKTGGMLAATQDGPNRVTVATGDCLVHGRHCSVTAPEQVPIASGTQGQRRSDLICMHYMRRGEGEAAVDSAELAVLRGAPTDGAPADPAVPAGNVLEGAADDWMPLYRVPIDGVTAGEPVPMFDVSPTVADLGGALDIGPIAPTPAAGVPADAVTAVRSGAAVSVTVSGSMAATGGVWDKVALASGLPVPATKEAYALATVQGQAAPVLLWIDWNGNLAVRGTGTAGYPGGWTFGTVTYVAADKG